MGPLVRRSTSRVPPLVITLLLLLNFSGIRLSVLLHEVLLLPLSKTEVDDEDLVFIKILFALEVVALAGAVVITDTKNSEKSNVAKNNPHIVFLFMILYHYNKYTLNKILFISQ